MHHRKFLVGSVAAILLIAAQSALAQNAFPTADPSKNVNGAVLMCLNGSNDAVPATTGGTCLGSSSGGVSPTSTSALAANQVIKAGAGSLYDFSVSADSTLSGAPWWVMIYNATTAPSDGSVTPTKCYALPSGATAISAAFPVPLLLSTGITIGVSTAGCFTKTASTHAFISGDAQ